MQKSVLLGNYEFYYVGGLFKKLFGLETSEDMQPLEMSEYILGQLDHLTPKDEKEEYLIKIVSTYEPLETYDEKMNEFFRLWASEKDLWKVTTNYNP